MKLTAFHDFALLEPLEPPEKMGNVFLPTEEVNKEMRLPIARVLSKGPEFETTTNTCTGQPHPSGISEGDVVALIAFQKLTLPGGVVYYLARRSQIGAGADLEGEQWTRKTANIVAATPKPIIGKAPLSLAGHAGLAVP